MSTRRARDAGALSEVVDPRVGSVRVSGHLTERGADLVRGTVQQLHRSGHARVLLDLQDVRAADDAGLRVLRDVGRELAAEGGELLVRNSRRRPARPASPSDDDAPGTGPASPIGGAAGPRRLRTRSAGPAPPRRT